MKPDANHTIILAILSIPACLLLASCSGGAREVGSNDPVADAASPEDTSTDGVEAQCSVDSDCAALDGKVSCAPKHRCQDQQCVADSSTIEEVCQTSDPCKSAYCDWNTGCKITNKSEGGACSSGDACLQSETCQSGVCTGGAPDCELTACGAHPLCGEASKCAGHVIGCQHHVVSHDTSAVSSADSIDNYGSCASGKTYSGPEVIYAFVAPRTEEVTLTFDTAVPGLTVFLLPDEEDDCAAYDCLATPQAGSSTLTFSATAGASYFFAVDGLDDAEGAFELTVSCPGESIECASYCPSPASCGGDGCDASCGECGDSETCQYGLCTTAPSNDTCKTAETMLIGDVKTGNTSEATDNYSLSQGECGQSYGLGAGAKDVVYRFDAPEDGWYTWELLAQGTEFDAVLYVATSCSSAQDLEASCVVGQDLNSDDLDGSPPYGGERVAVKLSKDQTAFIVVDSPAGGGTADYLTEGKFVLQLVEADCSATQPHHTIAALPYVAEHSTAGNKNAIDLPPSSGVYCGGAIGSTGPGPEVVYEYTPPSDQVLTISVTPKGDQAATFDPAILVMDCIPAAVGSCFAGAESDGLGAKETLDAVAVTQGQTVYVVVDGVEASTGDYDISITECVCDAALECSSACAGKCDPCPAQGATCGPTNKCVLAGQHTTCESAAALGDGDGPWAIAIDTTGGTADYTPPTSGDCTLQATLATGLSSNDAAVAFTNSSASAAIYHFTLSATDTTFDTALYIVSDCSNIPGTCKGADASVNTFGGEQAFVELGAGETAYAVVDGVDGSLGTFLLTVATCTPSCVGFECGSDGCGGSCGSCTEGAACESGICVKAPDNDVCGTATTIVKTEDVWTSGSLPTTGANDDYNNANAELAGCEVNAGTTPFGSGAPDVAFKYTATTGHTVSFSLSEESTTFDAGLYVMGDCAEIASCKSAANEGGSGQPECLDVTLASGEIVYVIVDGGIAGESGQFELVANTQNACDGTSL